jgi:hypothetical protein
LRKDRQNQLTYSASNSAEPADFNCNTALQELTNSLLNVDRVTTEPVDCGDMENIAFSEVSEQLGEARPVFGTDGAADPFVEKLFVEKRTPSRIQESLALRRDGLIKR